MPRQGRGERGHGNDRPVRDTSPCPLAKATPSPVKAGGASLRTPPVFRPPAGAVTYWQASQVPPLRIASSEQAFFSASVYSFFLGSTLSSFRSTVDFSMLEADSVRR